MKTVHLPKKTNQALGGLNVLRRPSRPVAAGFTPGRPVTAYLLRFA